jgi:DNA polymerase
MDPRNALLLQVEWGADETLEALPRSRLRPAEDAPPAPRPSPVPSPPRDGLAPARASRSDGPPGLATVPPTATLTEFVAALAGFDGAGLAATATNLVPPVGPPEGLMVVGEAPGAAEDRSGAAFVGPEGQLLRRMLGSIGVDPAGILLAYLAPWRPPGGRAPSEAEIAACLPWLVRLLHLARPRLLLVLGSVPSRALLGPAARRGRWTTLAVEGQAEAVPVLVTANPAMLARQPRQKASAWADMRLLRRKMEELGNHFTKV